MKSGVTLRCARSILVHTSHYSRLEKTTIPLATQDYHVILQVVFYHYAYARQTQVIWKKETKKRTEDKEEQRKNKKAKKRKRKGKKRKDKKSNKRQEKRKQRREKEKNVILADPKNRPKTALGLIEGMVLGLGSGIPGVRYSFSNTWYQLPGK